MIGGDKRARTSANVSRADASGNAVGLIQTGYTWSMHANRATFSISLLSSIPSISISRRVSDTLSTKRAQCPDVIVSRFASAFMLLAQLAIYYKNKICMEHVP